MLPWKVGIITVLCYSVCTYAAQHRRKALYPAAHRMKRDVINPTFHNSIEDVNLLFEILLSGVQLEGGHGAFVQDEELASLRKTCTLQSICEDIVPKKLTDIRRLTFDLSQHQGRLCRADFERTVLTMVYTANRLAHKKGHQRDVWAESFVSLYRAIKQDLTAQ